MKTKLTTILLLFPLLVSCKGEYNPSERRIFDYYSGFSIRKLPDGSFASTEVDVILDSFYGSRLTNVVIGVTFPDELEVGRVSDLNDSAIIKRDKHKVTLRYDTILETNDRCFTGDSECVGHKHIKIAFNGRNKGWSKPIEVAVSAEFNETVQGVSGGMIGGRYSKRVLLYQNEKAVKNEPATEGRLFPGGRWVGEWVYRGP